MSRYRRIVWNEGMLLSPHHFQQADNYHEALLNARIASLVPYEWGILDIEINRDAVANGYVELMKCSGVMPDGLMVNLPLNGPPPDPRPVEGHFPPGADHLDVYLAIPSARNGAASFQASGGEAAPTLRYWQEAGVVVDETTGDNEQQLAFARGNFRLLFADELRDGYSTIKIAELTRTATGQLSLVEHYVPPALSTAASAWLSNLMRQLVEFLIARSRSLGERRRQSGSGQVTFNTDDITDFWMLHTVNAAIPLMTHLFHTRIVHPERLYTALSALAGTLTTFSLEKQAKDVVRYDHTDLYNTFRQLDLDIRELLSTLRPERCVPIPLIKTRESVYVGQVNDDRLLKEAEFILGIASALPEPRLIERVQVAIKIADRDGIDAVINNALPGVRLLHASPPPGPIPARIGMQYFRLDRNDRDLALTRYWDRIIGLRAIAVWVPDEFIDPKLEMYAIKP